MDIGSCNLSFLAPDWIRRVFCEKRLDARRRLRLGSGRGAFIGLGVAIGVPYFQARKARERLESEARTRRLDAYYAVLALIDQQQKLLERVSDANFGWSTTINDLQKAQLQSDLLNNQRQSDLLQVDAFGIEVINFVLSIKQVGSFCGFLGHAIQNPDKKFRALDFRLLGNQAHALRVELNKDSLDVEELISSV